MYWFVYSDMHVHVYMLLNPKPTGFLVYLLEFQHIGITVFEQENFIVVGGSTTNRNGMCWEYDNEMIK